MARFHLFQWIKDFISDVYYAVRRLSRLCVCEAHGASNDQPWCYIAKSFAFALALGTSFEGFLIADVNRKEESVCH